MSELQRSHVSIDALQKEYQFGFYKRKKHGKISILKKVKGTKDKALELEMNLPMDTTSDG